MRARVSIAWLAPVIAALGAGPWPDASGQASTRYEVRLAATPRDTSMRATISGSGTAEVTVAGRTLTVSGRFSGLKSRATRARIHRGRAVAVRGPAVHDLELTTTSADGTAGTVFGELELDDAMRAALEAGHLYLQLDSAGAPDGNLWGWLYEAVR